MHFSQQIAFALHVLYGCAGRLTAKHGGFRPGAETQKIRQKKHTRNPDWMQAVTFAGIKGGAAQAELVVVCVDHETWSTDDELGRVTYPLAGLVPGRPCDVWLELAPPKRARRVSACTPTSTKDAGEAGEAGERASAGRVHLQVKHRTRQPPQRWGAAVRC